MARFKLIVEVEAYDDIEQAYNWYAARSESAADDFRSELRAAQERAASQPEWAEQHILNTRRISLRRFPYSIIFRQIDDTVVIIAVAHAKRDESFWQDR